MSSLETGGSRGPAAVRLRRTGSHGRGRRTAAVAAGVALVGAMLAGCDAQPADLAPLQRIADACPADHGRVDQAVAVDVSRSAAGATLAKQHATVLEAIVQRTAVCGGHLHVTAFTGSTAATTTVWDGDLDPAGATDIARLRKVPALVDRTVPVVVRGLAGAASALPQNGSDIAGQWTSLAAYFAQRPAAAVHRVDILTDGVQSAGTSLRGLTTKRAAQVAAAVALTGGRLPRGTVATVSGVGRSTASDTGTARVDALIAFQTALCERTGAARCVVVTDFAQ